MSAFDEPGGGLGSLLEELRGRGLRPTRVLILELDPNDPPKLATASHGTLAAVAEAWHACFQDRVCLASEVLRLCRERANDEAKRLDLALQIIAQETGLPVTPKRLGRWLGRHENRPIKGHCFVRSSVRDNSILWRLRAVK